jgi:CRISPR-associated endonuclease/helicase Cas3
MLVKQAFLDFWGKARPEATAAASWHPAACHCLDVAAVAEALLRTHPALGARMIALGGWTADDFIRAIVFLVALHDLGKFSRSFQGMVPEHWPQSLTGGSRRVSGPRHDALGLAMLNGIDRICDLVDQSLGQWPDQDIKAVLGAVAGHHGRPVASETLSPALVCRGCEAAAIAFLETVTAILLPPSLPPPPKGVAKRLSWWLAGVTTLSDWIGSATTWFPYVGDSATSLESYWPTARQQAEKALRDSGLLPAAAAPRQSLSTLIPFITKPTPMQGLAETEPLPDGPVCVIIEDATGGGKTEAALMIAHRLIAEGRADGLFVALPTMATADAMFARLAESYRALFDKEANPSLALAHGRAELNTLFRGSILAGAETAVADEGEPETETASAQCAAWLAEERRRVFFAHVGVGTIDQALLGVLAARHAALRLFGLSRKVLVVDEAHAYDPYMAEELNRLLTFHAMLGGSSVILSATLPQGRREVLLGAFARGLGVEPYRPAKTAYPLMTIAGAGQGDEHPAAMRGELCRTVPVRRLGTAEEAVAALAEAARAGACGIWVRNTVDDACAGAEALRAAGVEPILFHARFAMGDRLSIQNDVLCWFGKQGGAADRAPDGIGRVLVATQVVEQSLDLDADVMVTDLAPIDLVIQRAGRLQRHPDRPRPAGCERPKLLIVSPEPVAEPEAAWARDAALGGSAFVYPPHLLWRSARALFQVGEIAVPAGVRDLVEAVYGPEAEAVPAGLAQAEVHFLGTSEAARGQARFNLLDPAAGYALGSGTWESDVVMPTRLGDDYVTFRMAREENGSLVPFCGDTDPARAWALSEIALRRSIADDAEASPAVERLRAGWPKWQREIPVLVLIPRHPGGFMAQARRSQGGITLLYDEADGLCISQS